MLYCRNFPLAKEFIDKKGESIKNFLSEFYYLIMPKSFVKKPFSVSLFSCIEKI